MYDLSRSLVGAAAEAICPVASVEFMVDDSDPCPWEPKHWQKEARAAVAAVLETLAAHCDPVATGDRSTSQALLSNTELRRLAVEAREGDDDGR